MGAIADIYGRIPTAFRALPFLMLLPFAAELAQHAVEIGIGMSPGGLAAASAPRRLAFGVFKLLAILLTLIFLLRWWAFDRDGVRAARTGAIFWRGFATLILVQIGVQFLLLLIARALLATVGADAARGVRIAIQVAPLVLWLVVATLLIPWYVGLLTEDRAMTLRRAFMAVRRHVTRTFALLLAGVLPLMVIHYALGYGAMGRPPALVWGLLIVDAAVVAVLTVALASTYFTIYRQAALRSTMISGDRA